MFSIEKPPWGMLKKYVCMYVYWKPEKFCASFFAVNYMSSKRVIM